MLDPVELFPEVPNIYDFPSVHADMLYDERRVSTYRRAILSTVKAGDIVVDIGAGTGLLSFISLQAGASHVYAIERSNVINWAKDLAKKNGFSNRIEFLQCDARDVELPEKANVIVSELMGHVAFEEGMAETISDARRRFLKSDGTSIPLKVSLYAALVFEDDVYPNYIDNWADVCGIDFSSMKRRACSTAYSTTVKPENLLSKTEVVFSSDFTDNTTEFQSALEFTPVRPGKVNGVALWFDADLTPAFRLSSGPLAKTHWRQCFLPFHDYLDVSPDKKVRASVRLCFRKSPQDPFVFNLNLI